MRKRLGLLVPSRGRPAPAARLADAVAALSQSGSTEVLFGLDHDDLSLGAYMSLLAGRPGVYAIVGEREAMGPRTNTMWASCHDVYDYVASLGDDHLPRTAGWDQLLIGAIEEMGGTGIAYPDDLLMREKLPTAAVLSADIPAALGWLCLPRLKHYCVDNVFKDLGEGAGCLRYVPEAVVHHLHAVNGGASWDATYAEAGGFAEGGPDHRVYLEWKAGQAEADCATVAALRTRMVSGTKDNG